MGDVIHLGPSGIRVVRILWPSDGVEVKLSVVSRVSSSRAPPSSSLSIFFVVVDDVVVVAVVAVVAAAAAVPNNCSVVVCVEIGVVIGVITISRCHHAGNQRRTVTLRVGRGQHVGARSGQLCLHSSCGIAQSCRSILDRLLF